MLHDKVYSKQRKNSFLCREPHRESTSSKEDSSESVEEEKDAVAEIRKALAQGVPPFPYKVAKALDAEIYRNVEFDLWNESRKEQLRFEQMIIPDFAPGVKCLVRVDKDQTEPYHAHIQEMSPDQGPVTVFVEELGEKCTVPYENLEALPIPAYKVLPWQGTGNKPYRMLSEYLRSSLQGKLKLRPKQSKKSSKEVPIVIPFPSGISPPTIHFTTSPTFPLQGSPSKAYPIPSVSNYCVQPDDSTALAHAHMASAKYPEGHLPVVCLPSVQMAGSHNQQSSVSSLWGCGSSPYAKVQVPAQMKMAEQYLEPKDQCEKNESFSSEILLENDPKTSCFSCCTSLGQDINSSLDESDTNSSCNPVFCHSSNHHLTLLQSSEEALPHAVTPPSHPLHSSISAVNQPVTVYPCPVYSGMLLPYGESLSVNLNAWRSQDPTGSDLPLADLPTVRFFYNLGCDYFRMTSTMIPVATPSPYSTWTACNGGVNYAVGTACSSVPVPITGTDDVTQRSLGTSTYINTGSPIYPAQPMVVGSPPPTVSAHAVFYPSAIQSSLHQSSSPSHISPCVTSLP